MPIENGSQYLNIIEIDIAATQQKLDELGFNRAQLEKKHGGLSMYYWIDRRLKEELTISGKSFVLCVDDDGNAVHFRNGYLYLTVGIKPEEKYRDTN